MPRYAGVPLSLNSCVILEQVIKLLNLVCDRGMTVYISLCELILYVLIYKVTYVSYFYYQINSGRKLIRERSEIPLGHVKFRVPPCHLNDDI